MFVRHIIQIYYNSAAFIKTLMIKHVVKHNITLILIWIANFVVSAIYACCPCLSLEFSPWS